MAKLNAADKQTARGFLQDLFFVGGLVEESDLAIGTDINDRGGDMSYFGAQAHTICEEIKYRLFDFFAVDDALNQLAKCGFYANPMDVGSYNKPATGRKITRSAQKLAAFIADFCAECHIYWDDVRSNRTVQELEAYKQTIFGGALWNAGCFASQISTTSTSAATSAGATSVTKTPKTPKTPGTPPANNYKATGPRSGDARGLIGQPHDKTILTGKIWAIAGHNTRVKSGSDIAYAMVNPIEAKGADPNNPKVNKVFINSSHGYTDCACYFDNLAEAQAFFQKCQAICPSYVTGLYVGAGKPKPGGYFKVDTNFGPVYVVAQKLNEARIHAEELAAKKVATETTPKYAINDIKAFDEAFFKYE